ncbi:hypothetical protein ACF0H5_016508 [Mactra antiquata]
MESKNRTGRHEGVVGIEETSKSLLKDNIDTNEDLNGEVTETCTYCSQRWILAYMGLWLGLMVYLFNTNMSIAVVCMSKSGDDSKHHQLSGEIVLDGNASKNEYTGYTGAENISTVDSGCEEKDEGSFQYSQSGEFDWSKKTQSFILSGYFYGYMAAQIPAGWLATSFGGKRVVGVAMGLSCILTLLIPLFARTSIYLLIAARILQGLFNGTSNPSFCGLVGAWALPNERSRFLALCWFGQNAGLLLGFSTSGVLCAHGFDNGWGSIFYIHGIIGVLFVICWWYCVYSSPSEHPRLSKQEKKLLSGKLSVNKQTEKDEVPWTKILTYRPIYIAYIAHICDTWTYYMLLTCLPQFVEEVLKFNIQSNGLFSCLPSITMMIGIMFAGVTTDYLSSKSQLSITTIRKIYLITGYIGIAVFIITPGFLSCHQREIAILCLCLCTLFEAVAVSGGYTPNSVDIAPRYASVVFGISNTLASIPGIISPIIVAEITKNKTSEEWRIVFYISAAVALFGAIVYGLFANNEVVEWGDIHVDTELEVPDPIDETECVLKKVEKGTKANVV